MYKIEREHKILEIIHRERQASVEMLSKLFAVARETVRRDLTDLHKRGALVRTHGGAVLKESADLPWPLRKTEQPEIKERICWRASQFIQDGDTLYIDISSTTLYLLRHIPRHFRVTVLTNSVEAIQEHMRLKNENIEIICTGGVFRTINLSLTGSIARQVLMEFIPDRAFFSSQGATVNEGLTEGSLLEAEVKRQALNQSRESIFLLDHSKFGIIAPVKLCPLNRADYIITDDYAGVPLQQIQDIGVRVAVV